MHTNEQTKEKEHNTKTDATTEWNEEKKKKQRTMQNLCSVYKQIICLKLTCTIAGFICDRSIDQCFSIGV